MLHSSEQNAKESEGGFFSFVSTHPVSLAKVYIIFVPLTYIVTGSSVSEVIVNVFRQYKLLLTLIPLLVNGPQFPFTSVRKPCPSVILSSLFQFFISGTY